MASEKTPNLGLNQIDRTSPKTTYFDLEKYLDQNWRAVDKFAGGVNDSVNEIKKRLDTTERKAVTLEPGIQIVHAEKAAPFSLTGLSGRTLVNLLGRMGSCETVSEWSSNVAIAIDNNNKTNGSSSFKITLGSVPATASASFLTTPGRKYIAIADVKSVNSSKVAISINGIAGAVGNEVNSGSVFAPSVVRFTAKEYFHIVTITGTGATGNTFNMDSVRVYEISDTDYAVAASLTPAQAAAKYPYVDSVMPVRNPYTIRYGENLLPSVREWVNNGGLTDARVVIKGEYEFSIMTTTEPQWRAAASVKVVPNTQYTLSATHDGLLGIYGVNQQAVIINGVTASSVSFNSGNNTFVDISLTNRLGVAGTFTGKNFMLNIGNIAQPFKPRQDSMLALQTDLYADPVTGANADTVFERDGQYFKVKRFESVLLDGSRITKVNNVVSGVGFKALYPVVSGVNYAFVGNGSAVKFDGKILLWGGQDTIADRWGIDANSPNFAISVPVSDSGWADSYPPTLDDIRAYFFGYKAYDANTLTPAQAQSATTATWNGTGTKYWVQRIGAPNFTQSAPQQSYAGYTPYQLVYQLATPTVEPIVFEGQLSFVEGDNQVEVGTGLIVREGSKPGQSNNQMWINGSLNGLGKLQFRTNKIFAVYKNGKNDNWSAIGHASDVIDVYGFTQAWIPLYKFDSAASYSTTYLTLETSPIVPFIGSYAANEKTLLADLVDSVQQNTARVSVLENKKADKDNPAWLTPTLLNGWTGDMQYVRLSDGLVVFRGGIRDGAVTPGTRLFILPVGYRPKNNMEIRLRTSDGANDAPNSTIIIYTSGAVLSQNNWYNKGAWFDGLSFLAEQ
ncbi:hypothetical protein D1872_67120 [compost metagenome]